MSTSPVIASSINNSAGLTQQALAELNAAYAPLTAVERLQRLYRDFAPEKILVTSSFAATSAYFLHMIATVRPEQIIHFIDTGYHFAETLAYRDDMIERLHLHVINLQPDEYQHNYSQQEKLYETDPDFCCSINKVQPLDNIKGNYDVWVSSLMGWQTDFRSALHIFEESHGIIKFNPMIDVTREMLDQYVAEHQLPLHPLVAKGYSSIGCSHCTVPGEGRKGRWSGKAKTECGLHL
jgi:phosphoadenosine phosphosulfate reductase